MSGNTREEGEALLAEGPQYAVWALGAPFALHKSPVRQPWRAEGLCPAALCGGSTVPGRGRRWVCHASRCHAEEPGRPARPMEASVSFQTPGWGRTCLPEAAACPQDAGPTSGPSGHSHPREEQWARTTVFFSGGCRAGGRMGVPALWDLTRFGKGRGVGGRRGLRAGRGQRRAAACAGRPSGAARKLCCWSL